MVMWTYCAFFGQTLDKSKAFLRLAKRRLITPSPSALDYGKMAGIGYSYDELFNGNVTQQLKMDFSGEGKFAF